MSKLDAREQPRPAKVKPFDLLPAIRSKPLAEAIHTRAGDPDGCPVCDAVIFDGTVYHQQTCSNFCHPDLHHEG